MSAGIYSEKLVEPDDKMLAHDLAETKNYLDKITQLIESEETLKLKNSKKYLRGTF